MDEEITLDRSESTEEIEDKSEIEDADLFCFQCNLKLQSTDELLNHRIKSHPIFIYKCTIKNCERWFISKKNRDKHADNSKLWLHKSVNIKKPPLNAVFIEQVNECQLEKFQEVCQTRKRRGPRPKVFSEKEFLVGMPRDQLKRKIMESVVEKIDYLPNKRINNVEKGPNEDDIQIDSIKDKLDDSKYDSQDLLTNKSLYYCYDFSYLKVPVIESISEYSLDEFINKLINLLDENDPANYYKFPFIDDFAPRSSKISDQMYMTKVKENLNRNVYSSNIFLLKRDLLSMYSKGLNCFKIDSDQWKISAKLYQIVISNFLQLNQNFINSSIMDNHTKNNKNVESYLKILNPYNNGKINNKERIITIGDQIGQLTDYNAIGIISEKYDKQHLLSYLDYGTNFSFGPSYDSGSAYCTKILSDRIISSMNSTQNYNKKLNHIIPESYLNDDFNYYLMNVFTYDILQQYYTKNDDLQNTGSSEDDSEHPFHNAIQELLDKNWNCLNELKMNNYKRLSEKELIPNKIESLYAEKTLLNLTTLLSSTKPKSVYNTNSFKKLLQ